jgi:transitional endoplasmic reticulum ATPase
MFWGVAGTGKTELAIAIAKQRGWNLKVIGDVSARQPQENSRQNRITSLKLASKIFRNQPKTVLLFDEMEDLFKKDANAQFSKAFINRIIETTDIPIIWTTNALICFGQPVLRRMVYNIEFDVPPEEARFRIWEKYCTDYKVKVESDHLKLVAKLYTVPPAVIKNAVHVTSTAFGKKKVTEQELLEIVGSLDTLVNYGHKRKLPGQDEMPSTPTMTSPASSPTRTWSSSPPVGELQEQGLRPLHVWSSRHRQVALWPLPCQKLGKEVLFKRASDLQSMWVGECEKNIAKAFKEAKKKEMVLIIDEGDSFLRDRTKARNSWEISQVNEMLSQMERHPQPFILTTNLMKTWTRPRCAASPSS